MPTFNKEIKKNNKQTNNNKKTELQCLGRYTSVQFGLQFEL